MSTFIEEQFESLAEDPKPEKTKQTKKKLNIKNTLCNRTLVRVSFIIFFAIVIPSSVYFYVFDEGSIPEPSKFSCLADERFKVPCGKINISEAECHSVNCCFNSTTNVCYHYLPSMYYYEVQSNGTFTTARQTSPFNSTTIQNMKISVFEKTADTFSITLHKASEKVETNVLPEKNYEVDVSYKPLTVQVQDKDNDTILTTIFGPLIASENYWEWSFLLTNDTLFGLDRNVINLSGNETLTKVIYKNKDDHMTLPVFWAYQNKKFHGLAVKYDGPLEITILSSKLAIIKGIAGVKVELEVFLGPTPAELHRKMTGEIIVPPLWTLGTHICRRSSDTNMGKLIEDYKLDSQLQFDSDCIHENIFFALSNSNHTENMTDFTSVLDNLLKYGTKFLLNLPPQILADDVNLLYTTSKTLGTLLKFNNNSGFYEGRYLKKRVVYPDYSNPFISNFTEALLAYISEKIGLEKISGLVLNDNWPMDESYPKANGSGLPYFSKNIEMAMSFTVPWNVRTTTNQTLHMVDHNSYGTLQNSSIHNYLQKDEKYKDMFIISATKNFGDLEPVIAENFNTSWENFRFYLQKTLFSSITGNHLVGIPVCGDTEYYDKKLQESLCLRWYLAASTMPYFRVSSFKPFRDPESLETKFSTRYALMAMERRKLLQEHYYTILSRGEPIVRPMYFDYFENPITFNITSQYTIGNNLIVAHPLSADRTKLQVFLPRRIGVWYEFWGGLLYNTSSDDEFVGINVLETDWVSFVAQGSIIPLTKNLEINLTIALNCSDSCTAKGELYKDENYLQFLADETKLTVLDLPESCNYTLNYINLYYYNGTEPMQERISKNVTLCDEALKQDNATVIFYYELPDTTPETTTADL